MRGEICRMSPCGYEQKSQSALRDGEFGAESRRGTSSRLSSARDPKQKSRGTKPYSGTPAFRRLSSKLSKYDSFMRTNRLRTKPIENAG